jgi:hypothetical protein
MTRCLRQLVRPSSETITRVPGCGDCQTCTFDEANKNCSMYFAVNLTVEDTEHEKS